MSTKGLTRQCSPLKIWTSYEVGQYISSSETAWCIRCLPIHLTFLCTSWKWPELILLGHCCWEDQQPSENNTSDFFQAMWSRCLRKDSFILWSSDLIHMERQQVLQEETREACARISRDEERPGSGKSKHLPSWKCWVLLTMPHFAWRKWPCHLLP